MGNATNSSQGKSSATGTNTGQPAWSQPGTDAYKQMNQQFQTGPMAVANQTLAQGGQGATMQNVIGQIMGGGGSNDWMNQAANHFQNPGQVTVPGQVSEQNYQNIYNQAGQPGAAEHYLKGTAQGQYLGGSPYLDDIIAKGAQDVATQTNQMFAAGGRYGSAAHQGTVSDSVAGYANQLRNQNYSQERDRQIQAAGALENAQQARLGLQSGAASGLAGIQGQNIGNSMNAQSQNIANRLAAAGQLGELGQQRFNNMMGAAGLENQGFNNMLGMIGQLGNIQNNKIFDAQQQMGIGNQIDQRTQQQLTDLINQWTQTDTTPWQRLGGLLSTGTGTAGNWGTQTTKSTQPLNLVGILGGLAELVKASDRRLKEDIRRVGTLDNGLPVYAYRYKGEAITQIGLMADEVELVYPEAVVETVGGFKAVNYEMAVM
ncbi:MAG TPA: tail fiber domain-containing protein [Rhizobiaceae bacterium]|nr:tail fiber domain-containing protein [Rhizobiaceae bacterium]